MSGNNFGGFFWAGGGSLNQFCMNLFSKFKLGFTSNFLYPISRKARSQEDKRQVCDYKGLPKPIVVFGCFENQLFVFIRQSFLYIKFLLLFYNRGGGGALTLTFWHFNLYIQKIFLSNLFDRANLAIPLKISKGLQQRGVYERFGFDTLEMVQVVFDNRTLFIYKLLCTKIEWWV